MIGSDFILGIVVTLIVLDFIVSIVKTSSTPDSTQVFKFNQFIFSVIWLLDDILGEASVSSLRFGCQIYYPFQLLNLVCTLDLSNGW